MNGSLWTLQYREVTPKGKPGRVKWEEGLRGADLTLRLNQLLPKVCWAWVFAEDADFAGKPRR